MDQIDKKMKKLSDEFKTPSGYEDNIKNTLNSLPQTKEKDESKNTRKTFWTGVLVGTAVILLILAITPGNVISEAHIFERFYRSMQEFLGFGNDTSETSENSSADVTEKEHKRASADLGIELIEHIMDENSVYLLVKVSAPTEISFSDDIGFSYFGVCKGENYNSDSVLPGVKDCKLFEVSQDHPNVATYMLNVSTSETLEDGEDLCVFFRDLSRDPVADEPEVLVEGLWHISFAASFTIHDKIEIDGNSDMKFSFLDKSAFVNNISLSPVKLQLKIDVSEVPYDSLGISDTRLEGKLVTTEGDILISTRGEDDTPIVSSGSIDVSDIEEENTYLTYTFEFEKKVDINKILGIYIEDLFIPC